MRSGQSSSPYLPPAAGIIANHGHGVVGHRRQPPQAGNAGGLLSAVGMGPNWASGAERCPPPAQHPPACHGDLLPVPLPLLLCPARAGVAPAQPPPPAAPRELRGLGELIYYWPT